MDTVEKALESWVKFWNTYDIKMLHNLFLADDRVTYFSSEKKGLIAGYDALVEHHRGFGFVKGGKETGNRLWLEDVEIERFENVAVVKADWLFKRKDSDSTQKGPVTIVYLNDGKGPRIAHAHFSNY